MRLNYQRIPENWQHANSYLIQTDKNYLFDPSIEFDEEIAAKLSTIYATHFHFDHIHQMTNWRDKSKAKFSMPLLDKELLTDPQANCSLLFGQAQTFPEPDTYYQDDQIIEVEDNLFFHFYTLPGHSPGCSVILVSYKEENEMKPFVLISGDVLFAESIGRTDLKGGNPSAMQKSLKRLVEIMRKLPEDLPVLPGHGPVFQVKDAFSYNPYIRYFL